MNEFDKIINSILNEKHQQLPVLDGNREIYSYIIDLVDAKLHDDQPQRHNEDYDEQEWDDDFDDYGAAVVCTTENFQQALQGLKELYATHANDFNPSGTLSTSRPEEISQQDLQTITDNIGNLIGTWKVIDDTANSNSIMIGVKVDLSAYSSVYNSIQDDIKDF